MLIKADLSFEDERGSLLSYRFKHKIVETNFIVTNVAENKSKIRGNHYHKLTYEYLLIVNGSMELHYIHKSAYAKRKKYYPILNEQTIVLNTGDMFLIKPNVYHWSIFTEKTTYFNFLSKKFNQNNPDSYQL